MNNVPENTENLGAKIILTDGKVHNCKKCGDLTAWQKSNSGKWYLVNAYYDVATPVCFRADFHSKTCGTKKVEEVSVTNDFSLNIEEIEAYANNESLPVGEVENSVADDSFAKVQEELTLLKSRIENFTEENIDPWAKVINEMRQAETDLMLEVEKKILAFRQEAAHALGKKRDMELALKEMENRVRALEMEKNAYLAALAARQQLLNLYNSLAEAWEAMPWNDAMMDFQKEDILTILDLYKKGKNGVLNANDRGMGKTFETGAAIDIISVEFEREHGRLPRVLWLTKKGLVGQTFREHLRWNSERKMVVLGSKGIVKGALYDTVLMGATKEQRDFQVDAAIATNAWIISNYDILNTTPRVVDVPWDIVVVDEVHKLKGGANCTVKYCTHDKYANKCRATGLWRKTKEIVDAHNPFFLPLSGTPIQNHPKDMWAYLHLFQPQMFPSPKRFVREYAYGYGMVDKNGEKFKVDWERLINVMKDQVIRRRKDEVGMDLPDKVVEYIVDELGAEADFYRSMQEKFIIKLEGMGDKPLSASFILPQINYLQQILQNPGGVQWKDDEGTVYTLPETPSMKMNTAMELIEELVSEGEQVVVFSTFNHPLVSIAEKVNAMDLEFNGSGNKVKAEVFTGKQNSDGTGDYIQQRFQEGVTQVLCCNIEAGGEGLNLQKNPSQWAGGAAHAIFLNLWWNPAKNEQAEDRLHRKGQTDQVTIHVIQAESSVDAMIAAICKEKQEMSDGIMESDEIRPAIEWAQILKNGKVNE